MGGGGRLIRLGTCAFSDHTDFYPPGTRPGERLAYYARFFDLVEIDSTFYAPPDLRRVHAWIKAVPDDFTFDMKAHGSITGHLKTPDAESQRRSALAIQREALAILGDAGRLGCLLCQFAPWVHRDDAGQALVERALEDFAGFPVAVEFRHRSWFAGSARTATLRWLRTTGAVHVVADEPQVSNACVPLVPEVTLPVLSVMRLHGRNRETWVKTGLASSQDRFDYLYREEELQELGALAQDLAEKAQEVHLLTNNNRANYAVQNALQLKGILTGQALPPPTLF